MSSLTKTALAVFTLSSSVIFAGTMGPACIPGSVFVPCETVAWDFGISALYLQPIYDADFGYYNSVTQGAVQNYLAYNKPWDWGLKLEGSHQWGYGSDIHVEWYHLKATVGPHAFGPETIGSTTVLSGLFERENHWDAVNLEFAQQANAGQKLWRFHGGVQFASIKTHEDRFFPLVGTTAGNAFRSTTFTGFGPRTGLDATYQFCNGWGVYAKSAVALLVGSSKFSNSSNFVTQSYSYGSKSSMVPELEAKLGLDWVYGLAQGDITFDFGYMWFNYFNAQHNLNTTPTLGIESDFAASGLYFGVVYRGVV
ncbi:MAG: hypothetical protein H0U75_11460 [Legionella sp.]|nr:hypothetical protein [Legionella sp.]